MENNLDKDIKRLKDLIQNCNFCNFAACEQCEINWNDMQSISNVLSELKEYKDIEQDYIANEEKLADYTLKLETEIEIYKEEFKKINKALNLEEGIVAPYTSDIIEGLKRCVIQQQKELEINKKIAYFLGARYWLKDCEYADKFEKLEDVLDWARKEVEKDEI